MGPASDNLHNNLHNRRHHSMTSGACARSVLRTVRPSACAGLSYGDAGKIKTRAIVNLSDWPTEIVEGLRTLLKGGKVAPADQESIIVRRALPHGHVAAVLARCATSASTACWGRRATAAVIL